MRHTLELSETTYQLLAALAAHQQRPLEEMLRLCLRAYEERCDQQANHQMRAEGLLLPFPTAAQLAAANEDFEPEPIAGKPLSEMMLAERRSWRRFVAAHTPRQGRGAGRQLPGRHPLPLPRSGDPVPPKNIETFYYGHRKTS